MHEWYDSMELYNADGQNESRGEAPKWWDHERLKREKGGGGREDAVACQSELKPYHFQKDKGNEWKIEAGFACVHIYV